MTKEYIIEIQHQPTPFKTKKEAIEWIKKNLKRGEIDVRVVSQDIDVIIVWE